jgi:hypothetical protein
MLDLFAAVPRDLQQRRLKEYEQYLCDRDGEMDLKTLSLSKREELIAKHEALPAVTRDMDAAEFKKQYTSFDRRTPPSPEMTLLLTLVKVNASEAYGVSRAMQSVLDRATKNGDQCELRILCEEQYHTRILLSSANLYGIEVNEPYHPPSVMRILIGGMANLPRGLAHPLTLAGEIFGSVLFARLLGIARQVLKDAPQVRDAIEERLIEIWADERGHISYHRLTMGPAGLAQTRLILPMLNRAMMTAMPEAVASGAITANIFEHLPLIADPKQLPEAVRQQAFLA